MSIATRTGDDGKTGLMYGRRVTKCDRRVEAYGSVDELNAALGMARATSTDPALGEELLRIQKELITVMGELATPVEELARYEKDGYPRVHGGMVDPLDEAIRQVESVGLAFKGWVLPGGTVHGAALDMARTVCRRAERRTATLQEMGALRNDQILIFLNRLSDLLWLWARLDESRREA